MIDCINKSMSPLTTGKNSSAEGGEGKGMYLELDILS